MLLSNKTTFFALDDLLHSFDLPVLATAATPRLYLPHHRQQRHLYYLSVNERRRRSAACVTRSATVRQSSMADGADMGSIEGRGMGSLAWTFSLAALCMPPKTWHHTLPHMGLLWFEMMVEYVISSA